MSSRQEVVYNKNKPLEKVFRNATSRVLDFLLLNYKFDYSASELSKLTQIPLRTLQRVLPNLVSHGLVKDTGKVGNTTMYIINTESKLVQALQQYLSTSIDLNFQEGKKQRDLARRNKV
jgi:predicted transcriptional regulator